jgi:hypothetical protein
LRVDWAIPCRYVEVNDGLATIVGAGVDTFWVPEMPAAVGVLIAIRIVGSPEEMAPGVEHNLVVRVLDPGMEEISRIEGRGGASGTNPLAQEGFEQASIIPTMQQFEVPAEGNYTIEIRIDDRSATVPIRVIEGPPAGMEGPPE